MQRFRCVLRIHNLSPRPETAQGHVKSCPTPLAVAVHEDTDGNHENGSSDGGDEGQDSIPENPRPTAQQGDEDQTAIPHVKWGPDVVQDTQMAIYGFLINKKWNLAICTTCNTGVGAEKLHSHLNNDLKPLGIKVPRTYCKSIIANHHLLPRKKLMRPTSIIPPIHGLPLKSNMKSCGNCGYAANVLYSIQRHQAGKCENSGVKSGYAQTFFPETNRDFFAVEAPQASAPKPDVPTPLSTQFQAQYAGPSGDSLITVPSNTRDMNHFLTLGNWFEEVDGLTGKEARDISRGSASNLHALIRKSVTFYVTTMNEELRKEDPAVKVTMGDYNK